jgi:hypothetical protein
LLSSSGIEGKDEERRLLLAVLKMDIVRDTQSLMMSTMLAMYPDAQSRKVHKICGLKDYTTLTYCAHDYLFIESPFAQKSVMVN